MALEGRPFNSGVNVTATVGGASADVIYTVPSNHYAEVTFLNVSNGSGANQDISIEKYDASSAAYTNITNSLTITNKQEAILIGAGRLYLFPGDKLVASVDGGNIDVTVSGLLHFKQV